MTFFSSPLVSFRRFAAGAPLALALTGLTACGGGGDTVSAPPDGQALKSAHTLDAGTADAWTTIANEGERFAVAGTQIVRYGSGSTWIMLQVDGSGECSNSAFGADPLFGVYKQCQVQSTAADGWTRIAVEPSSFTVNGTQTVRYGSGTSWITKTISGGGDCSNAFFGGDPLFGVVKECEVMSAGDAAPPPTPTPTPAAGICTPPVAAADTAGTAATVGDGTAASCTEAALRSAVQSNSVVKFNCGAAPATIAISNTIDVPTTRDTVIDGENRITLDGGSGARIFNLVQPNYRTNLRGLTLQHITLRNGRAPGGGYVAPNPANPSCAYGYATGSGAAIEVRDARLHVIDVRFQDNAAATPGPDVGGGAVYALGSLDVTIVGSQFVGNSGSNAGAVGMLQSNLRVFNSEFSGNAATGVGQNYASADVASCPGVGGPGQGGAGGNGGAIGIDGSDDTDVIVCGSSFIGNRANELAGALFRTANYGPRRTSIDRSAFQGNAARQGGALFIMNSAPLDILASTFSGNSAVIFGAAHLQNSQFNIVNTTFSGNLAMQGVGGALFSSGSWSNSLILNSTFADNRASGGPGYFSAAMFGDSYFPINNTVFSNNTSDDPWNPMQCSFVPANGAGDMQWPSTRTVGGGADVPCINGIAFADPLLAPLANNGGPTATHLPAPDSPLRGAGRDCPATDQRGNPRNNFRCTIGAVE